MNNWSVNDIHVSLVDDEGFIVIGPFGEHWQASTPPRLACPHTLHIGEVELLCEGEAGHAGDHYADALTPGAITIRVQWSLAEDAQ